MEVTPSDGLERCSEPGARTAEEQGPYLYPPLARPEVTVQLPRLVHFIWSGDTIPQKYIDNIRSTQICHY